MAEGPGLKFIDLFAGIGGMRIAFEGAGGTCVFTSEWDPSARETYCFNFKVPEKEVAGDINLVPPETIPDHHVLVAGFPCQPFSLAGVSKKNSLGRPHGFLDKTQGTLFFNVAQILDAKRPDAFLLENVKHLLRHDRGQTFQTIMDTLSKDLGYHVAPAVIDGGLLVPQHRERVYIVGFKEPLHFRFPRIRDTKPKFRDILLPDEEIAPKYTLTDHLWQYLQAYARKHQALGNGFGCTVTDLDGKARTLSARYHKDGSEILVPQQGGNPRRLTPQECARLMGFPKRFRVVVADTQAYRQFGNSVVVPVVERVAKAIAKSLRERRPAKEPFPYPGRTPQKFALAS